MFIHQRTDEGAIHLNVLFHKMFQKTRYLNKELNQALKEHALHASQWSVLYCVHEHGQMTLTDIWKYLNVEAPTTTRTVNRLAELGWLTIKQGEDRREKMVSLSQEAVKDFPTIEATIIQFEKQFLAGLSMEEQVQLIELLSKMAAKG